jgi:hypothetical protein
MEGNDMAQVPDILKRDGQGRAVAVEDVCLVGIGVGESEA